MIKKRIALTAVCFLMLTGQAMAAEPKNGGTLVFGRGGDSAGLDPAFQVGRNSY